MLSFLNLLIWKWDFYLSYMYYLNVCVVKFFKFIDIMYFVLLVLKEKWMLIYELIVCLCKYLYGNDFLIKWYEIFIICK